MKKNKISKKNKLIKRSHKKDKRLKTKGKKRFKFINKEKILTIIFLFILIYILIKISIKYIFFPNSALNHRKYNYSCDLYINKSLSYDENGELLYYQNKVLDFNKLDKCYYGTNIDNSKFNNIHIAFAFDNDYILLSSITITNILNVSNPNTFINFHIIATTGFEYKNMKKLYGLKSRINNNSNFIFYNGSRADEDFGNHIKNEGFRAGEYAKLLVSVLIDDSVDRVIVLDAGDLLIEKDLIELYNYPLDDYLVRGAIDPYVLCFIKFNYFFHRYNYTNAGIYLYNLKKWRELNLYPDIVTFYQKFHFEHKLPTAHQDFINCFLPYKSTGLLPLKYNVIEYIFLDKDDTQLGAYIYNKRCSYYYNNKKAVLEAQKDVVIWHYNHHKIHNGANNIVLTKKWKEIVKLTGFYDEICQKYPKGCSKVE